MHNIGNAVGSWLYVIAGALAFAEASFLVGFVLPGETALLVAGYFCRYGPLNVWVMAVVAPLARRAMDRRAPLGQGRAVPAPARRQGRVPRPAGRAAAGADAVDGR